MARSNNILLFISILGFIALFDLSEKWAFQEIEKEELFSCPDFGANFKFSNEPKYSGKVLDDITVEIRSYELLWGQICLFGCQLAAKVKFRGHSVSKKQFWGHWGSN